MRYIVLFCLFFLFYSCQSNESQRKSKNSFFEKIDISNSGFIYDDVGLLDSIQKKQLSLELEKYYKRNGIEILCIIIPSFKEFGDEMKYTDYFLYHYDNDALKNLVLVVLFSEDRKLFIRTTKRSESYYSQERCKEIMDLYMLPRFKDGDFYEGFKNGVNELVKDNL